MIDRLKGFMQGRYGNDAFNIFLILLGCALSILLTLFIPSRFYYFRSLGTVLYLVALIRVLSRNLPKRQRENAKFLEKSEPWRKYLYKKFNQYQDKTHRYYNCPGCHRTLRVPKGKGKINITCPHCNRQFKKRT